MHKSIHQRFTEKVKINNVTGCHIWTAAFRGGYGVLWVNKRNEPAHRVSWALNYGAIPDGKWVLHRCDVRACVNPTHLFLGDHAANMADMVKKGRNLRGEGVANSKLTADHIKYIRGSDKTQQELAEEFNVHPSNISLIKRRKHWAHVK